MAKRLLAAFTLLFVAACAGLPFNVQPLKISVADLDVQSLGLFEQHFDVTLRVANPNDFDLAVEGLEFDLEVNGKPFAQALGKTTARVPALSSATLRVDAVTQSIDLLRQFKLVPPEALKAGVPYRIKGRIKVDRALGWVPFEQTGVFGTSERKPREDAQMI